jgi:hypothetical protein
MQTSSQSEKDIPSSLQVISPFDISIVTQVCADCSIDISREMPHPLRLAADGRPVYSVFVVIFVDDVSGNVSKQWNKHYACYMSNASLPHSMLDQEYNVRFVGASPSVGALELIQGVRESFEYVYPIHPYAFKIYLTASKCIHARCYCLRLSIKDRVPLPANDSILCR